jgi:hypothetical protein
MTYTGARIWARYCLSSRPVSSDINMARNGVLEWRSLHTRIRSRHNDDKRGCEAWGERVEGKAQQSERAEPAQAKPNQAKRESPKSKAQSAHAHTNGANSVTHGYMCVSHTTANPPSSVDIDGHDADGFVRLFVFCVVFFGCC